MREGSLVSDPLECSECGARLKAENEGSHMAKVHPRVSRPARPSGAHPRTRRPLYVTSKTKKALFALFAVAILAIAAGMLVRSAQTGTPVDPTAIPVRISMSGFSPSALTATVGVPLRVNLINLDNQYHTDGGGWHDFVVEAFGMNITVEPLGQRVFTVPTSTPGAYTWYCDLCCGGKESPSMVGTIRIS